jgi:hypothetical protein
MRRFLGLLSIIAFTFTSGLRAFAASSDAAASPASEPVKYEAFVKGATVTNGLIGVIRKSGKVYLAVSKAQLGQDFIEIAVPATGLGGFGPAPGEPYVAPARIMRFERVDDNIVIRWPNTIARVDPNSPQAAGTQASLASSIVGRHCKSQGSVR